MIIIAAKKKTDPRKILMNYNCMGKSAIYTINHSKTNEGR